MTTQKLNMTTEKLNMTTKTSTQDHKGNNKQDNNATNTHDHRERKQDRPKN